MKKLWQKTKEGDSDYPTIKLVEDFTVGNDPQVDIFILQDDCAASIAHAGALLKAQLLSEDEFRDLHRGLRQIIELNEEGRFVIEKAQEDCHTAIEQWLTKNIGAVGKKIHLGRSRNDQVLTAVRLFSRRKILELTSKLIELTSLLLEEAKKYSNCPMPGYTHTQPAMPMTLGLFLSAYLEDLLDDVRCLEYAYAMNNQSPLGSAAGFGSVLDLDRDFTCDFLGFDRLQINSLYCQNSRGKMEGLVLNALLTLQNSLSKFANDLIRFNSRELSFLSLDDEVTTGSSIMPQKRNPDVLELIRAKAATLWGARAAIQNLATNLPSGYNRDFQLAKAPLVESFQVSLSSAEMTKLVLEKSSWNEEPMLRACSKEIYAADIALERSQGGVPFRDAYSLALSELENVEIDGEFIKSRVAKYRTKGSMGRPGFDLLSQRIAEAREKTEAWHATEESLARRLLSPEEADVL